MWAPRLVLLVITLTLGCGPALPNPSASQTGADEAGTETSATDTSATDTQATDTQTTDSETETTDTSTSEATTTTSTSEPETDADPSWGHPDFSSQGIPDVGELECDGDALSECFAEVAEQTSICRGACPPAETCDAQACHWDCLSDAYEARLSCFNDHCRDGVEQEDIVPLDCYLDALECAQAPMCGPHACAYELYTCLWQINFLGEMVLRFDYVGSCALELPGPPHFPELSVLLFGEPPVDAYELGDAPPDCEQPEIGGTWNAPDFDVVTLCPEQCESFMIDGVVRIDYGVPAP